jgi:hypothetical protein
MGGACGTNGGQEERVEVTGRKARGKETATRPRCRWVDNIRSDLGEVGRGGVDWIGLVWLRIGISGELL